MKVIFVKIKGMAEGLVIYDVVVSRRYCTGMRINDMVMFTDISQAYCNSFLNLSKWFVRIYNFHLNRIIKV